MKRLITLLLLMAALSGVAFASPQQDFIDRMGPIAQEILPGYGLWPSVFLAQSALESNWGRSDLVAVNNLFGRKCAAEPCVWKLTPEYRQGAMVQELHAFQAYGSISEAVHDYCRKYFRTWSDGTPVYHMDASTPETFIRSVAGRYASDPKYADKVLAIINDWGLRQWDQK